MSTASCTRQSTGNPNENPTPAARHASAKSWVDPAVSQRTNTFDASALSLSGFGRHAGGSDANACSRTVMWSAAVLDPARPLRNNPARASPPAISGRSKNASNGCRPNDFFQVGVANSLLSE
ncbi:Uncharacterised protein [Mycobacterium tuberculosis]|nr:Uncharacterised protein [Mycobacterium tuberculosis]